MVKLDPAKRKAVGRANLSRTLKKTVANKYGVRPSTVTRWQREAKKSHPKWQDAKRSGRPRRLNARSAAAVRRSGKAHHSAGHIAKRVTRQTKQSVSSSTVTREMHRGRIDLQYLPLLHGRRLSSNNADDRATFCLNNRNAHTRTWVSVDSKVIYLTKCATGTLRMSWQNPEDREQAPRSGKPWVLHFYGAVGWNFKSKLIFCDPTPALGTKDHSSGKSLDSDGFISQVLPVLVEEVTSHNGGQYKVCLDNAPWHTSKASQAAMAAAGLRLVEDFPAQSWDINIIEFVWGMLVEKLQQRRPRSFRGWRDAIKEEWEAIDQASINKLVLSLKDRMAEIAEQNGQWLGRYVSKE